MSSHVRQLTGRPGLHAEAGRMVAHFDDHINETM
jgi:hypothetical protein